MAELPDPTAGLTGEARAAFDAMAAARAYLTETLSDIYAAAGETGAIGLHYRARVRLAWAP